MWVGKGKCFKGNGWQWLERWLVGRYWFCEKEEIAKESPVNDKHSHAYLKFQSHMGMGRFDSGVLLFDNLVEYLAFLVIIRVGFGCGCGGG